MKIIVVGGVAGGASAAAKMARLNSSAEIIMFERGEYISFANCGLPYHIGNVIKQRDRLMVMTPEKFKGRTGIDVRIKQEVSTIDPEKKEVVVKNLDSGESYVESYDKLLLATGSSPLVPPLPGLDDPDVMTLWTIPDMDRIKAKVDAGIKHAVVVGGGFIGLEVAENLVERGVKVTLVEMLPQVLPPLDPEIAGILEDELTAKGIDLKLNSAVTAVSRGDGLAVELKDGAPIKTDLVVLSVGVRPNSQLAAGAGLAMGERGGIIVNGQLQTSNPDIYAVGDVIQVTDLVMDQPTMIPLAGPANRQGRIAANNIFGGNEEYKGSLGTAICKIFDLTTASVGASEKRLKQAGRDYLQTYIAPQSHVSYYPGAQTMILKLLFEQSGKILGAQIVGRDGVDKRIDVIATAIRGGMTVADLADLELAYAPPYGSAKDPVNYAGFVAGNIINGTSKPVNPDALPENSLILDVREPDEIACGAFPGALDIPLDKLRDNLDKIPKDKAIVCSCKEGLRGYLAECYLREQGFDVSNLNGGYLVWKLFNRNKSAKPENKVVACSTQSTGLAVTETTATKEIDACGLQCPGPIVQVKNSIDAMTPGEILKVTANDAGFVNDLPAWCESTGNQLVSLNEEKGIITGMVSKGASDMTTISNDPIKKRTTIVLFSGDLDKAMAAFIMATGFASLGHEVSVFCTFWGLNVLRKDNPPPVKKDILSKMFGMMMPRGAKKMALSKMHMMGCGTAMMKYVMNSKNVDSLPELISKARLMGVQLLACDMAMNIMGLSKEELLDDIKSVGVAHFAALAEKSGPTLFI
jgi:NADPH-dependent 2,4-dienoyl-CoA reductase/sulfur reductase-like enzyme/peroxiredoxin family protein/TusA-related sulfurtransferase/rhodanese-related sulfurtransferase